VWTPKFWGWTSSSIALNQADLGRPTGLRQSGGRRSAAAMTRWWSSSGADRAKCPKNLNRNDLTFSDTGKQPVMLLTVSLVVCLVYWIRKIFRRHQVSKASRRFAIGRRVALNKATSLVQSLLATSSRNQLAFCRHSRMITCDFSTPVATEFRISDSKLLLQRGVTQPFESQERAFSCDQGIGITSSYYIVGAPGTWGCAKQTNTWTVKNVPYAYQ